ncbi:hypothetical protein SBC1_79530 (plasmid) [Caballeronia sp. SBC1]|nr:hypothetical protein SBC1_79530 [Caballeronia sp. SBC1]
MNSGVIAFVCPECDLARRVVKRLAGIVDHYFGRFALGVAVGQRHHGAGDQPMAVVAQRVAHVA